MKECLRGKCSKIVFIGGGGHCRSVIDSYIQKLDSPDIAITDANLKPGTEIMSAHVVGDDTILQDLFNQGYTQAAITLGSTRNSVGRRRIFEEVSNIGFLFPNIIDTTSVISSTVTLGEGIYIGKNAVINVDTVIKDFAIINTGAIIEHDCSIGNFAHIAVGAVICGGCVIEGDVFVGANATVIQGVKIGKGSVIGANSVVLADVPVNTRVVGVWSRSIEM